MGHVPIHEPREEADKDLDDTGGPQPPAREEGDALDLQSPVVAAALELASSFDVRKFSESTERHFGECSRRISPRGFTGKNWENLEFLGN